MTLSAEQIAQGIARGYTREQLQDLLRPIQPDPDPADFMCYPNKDTLAKKLISLGWTPSPQPPREESSFTNEDRVAFEQAIASLEKIASDVVSANSHATAAAQQSAEARTAAENAKVSSDAVSNLLHETNDAVSAAKNEAITAKNTASAALHAAEVAATVSEKTAEVVKKMEGRFKKNAKRMKKTQQAINEANEHMSALRDSANNTSQGEPSMLKFAIWSIGILIVVALMIAGAHWYVGDDTSVAPAVPPATPPGTPSTPAGTPQVTKADIKAMKSAIMHERKQRKKHDANHNNRLTTIETKVSKNEADIQSLKMEVIKLEQQLDGLRVATQAAAKDAATLMQKFADFESKHLTTRQRLAANEALDAMQNDLLTLPPPPLSGWEVHVHPRPSYRSYKILHGNVIYGPYLYP